VQADGNPPGQVAAHLAGVRPTGDGWVLARLREAARAAMDSGAPHAAAGLPRPKAWANLAPRPKA
jgi:hypothetical protein